MISAANPAALPGSQVTLATPVRAAVPVGGDRFQREPNRGDGAQVRKPGQCRS